MPTPASATRIFEKMMAQDHFSQWLGIQCVEIRPGYCVLEMSIRPEMLNGFAIAHGAITYALADSALAFASNSQGKHAVSVETSISHLFPVPVGATLRAIASEIHLGNKIAHYQIEIFLGSEKVAFFKGTVYRSSRSWEES